MGIELYSKLKEYLENHLEQIRPVCEIMLMQFNNFTSRIHRVEKV